MRKINKAYASPPAELTSIRCKRQLLRINNTRNGSAATYYHKAQVVTELNKLYHNKCGYCEARINVVATENVEHYRPKASVNTVDLPAGTTHRGYYWLGNEWSNLLIACPKCNQNGNKGTRFPLRNMGYRISTPPALSPAGEIVIASNSHSLAPLSAEDPLILNPEVKYPKRHLKIIDTGELVPVRNSIYARTTIGVCDLNRDPLVAARKRIIDDIIIELEKKILSHNAPVEPLTEYQFRRELDGVFDWIAARLKETATFTLVGAMLVKDFDTLILAKLDPVFRPVIRDQFNVYLNS